MTKMKEDLSSKLQEIQTFNEKLTEELALEKSSNQFLKTELEKANYSINENENFLTQLSDELNSYFEQNNSLQTQIAQMENDYSDL